MDNTAPMTGTTVVPFKPREITAQPLDAERLLERWKEGRSPQTVRAYANDLRQFSAWAGRTNAGAALTWMLSASHGEANEIAHQYRGAMLDQGLAPATVNRRLAALRSIVELGQRFGMIAWSLKVDGVKSEAFRDTAGPGTSVAAAMKLKAEQHANPAKAARDVAILRILYDLALRRAEVAGIKLVDLDLRAGKLSVLRKGKREKIIYTLAPRTIDAVATWLKHRGKKPGFLFVNFHRAKKTTEGLTGSGIYYVIRALGESVDARARPHGFRHTSITVAYQATKDPAKAKAHAGHAGINMTMRYVDAVEDVAGEVSRLVSETL